MMDIVFVQYVLRFGCLLYYVITITFRLCFLTRSYYPFSSGFTILHIGVLFDYMVDFFFIIDSAYAIMLHIHLTKNNAVAPADNDLNRPNVRHRGTVLPFHAASKQSHRQSLVVHRSMSQSLNAVFTRLSGKGRGSAAVPVAPTPVVNNIVGSTMAAVRQSSSKSKKTKSLPINSNSRNDTFNDSRRISRVQEDKVLRQGMLWDLSLLTPIVCLWYFILLCPFEVIGYAVGMQHYHWLRGIRLLRCVYFHRYWAGVKQLLAAYKLIQSAGAQRIVYISLVMALIAHVSACAFYALAITEMEHGTGTTWLSEDNLVELEESQTGGSGGSTVRTLHMLRPLRFRYLRAVYWSVQTLTSVAFGDITAFTEAETWYCVVFFYLAALLVYFSIANLTMVITSRDSAKTENLVRIAKFEEYAAYRRLPLELTNRVVSYYEYQWERLQGIEEEQILREIPANISQQVLQQVVRDLLVKVELLQDLHKGCLNILSERIEAFIFSPTDIIVEVDSLVSGLFMIASGEVWICWHGSASAAEPLSEGQHFGVLALEKNFYSANQYRAQTFTEIMLLRGSVFRHVCQMHLSSSELETLVKKIAAVRLGGGTSANSGDSSSGSGSPRGAGAAAGAAGLLKATRQMSQAAKLSRNNAVVRGGDSGGGGGRSTVRLSVRASFVGGFKRATRLGTFLSRGRPGPVLAIAGTCAATTSSSSATAAAQSFRGLGWDVDEFGRKDAKSNGWRLELFSPDSHFRTFWELLLFAGLSFYIMSCGLLLAAMLRQKFFQHYYTLLTVCYVVDIVFFIDIILNATVFGYFENGVVKIDTPHIFHRYLTEIDLMLPDVLAQLPIDLLVGALVSPRLIPVLRLNRLLQLRRFSHLADNLEDSLREYFSVALSFEMKRFLELYYALFMICHWAACAWQLIADVSLDAFKYDTNWREVDASSALFSGNYGSLSGTSFYFRALFWAINVLSSVGATGILPVNPVETVSIIVIMFFGYLLFNTMIGAIASLMGNFNKDMREFAARVERMRQLVKHKAIPRQIEGKILRYEEYKWARYGGVNEAHVLSSLPPSLRSAIAVHVLGPLLHTIPFFCECSEPMELMIVSLFQTRVFLDGDPLMLCGDVGKDMFIIEQGQVEVTSADRAVLYARLGAGDYIGESCLLDLTKRTASVFAVGYVSTYCLTSDAFLQAAEKFPSEYESIVEAMEEALKAKEAVNRSKVSFPHVAKLNDDGDDDGDDGVDKSVKAEMDLVGDKVLAPAALAAPSTGGRSNWREGGFDIDCSDSGDDDSKGNDEEEEEGNQLLSSSREGAAWTAGSSSLSKEQQLRAVTAPKAQLIATSPSVAGSADVSSNLDEVEDISSYSPENVGGSFCVSGAGTESSARPIRRSFHSSSGDNEDMDKLFAKIDSHSDKLNYRSKSVLKVSQAQMHQADSSSQSRLRAFSSDSQPDQDGPRSSRGNFVFPSAASSAASAVVAASPSTSAHSSPMQRLRKRAAFVAQNVMKQKAPALQPQPQMQPQQQVRKQQVAGHNGKRKSVVRGAEAAQASAQKRLSQHAVDTSLLAQEADIEIVETRAVASVGNIHPDSFFKLCWDVGMCCILLYYSIVIPMRIVLHISPYLLVVDYICDLFMLLDSYLCIAVFAIYAGGELLVYDDRIRANYMRSRFAVDLLSELPWDVLALVAYVSGDTDMALFVLAVLRLPKLVKLWVLPQYYAQLQLLFKKLNVSFFFVRLMELSLSILLIGNWVGCAFYSFAVYHRRDENCTRGSEDGYDTSCEFRSTWVEQQILVDRLPNDGGTQWSRFLRAYYWATTTSVAVSLGDVLAVSSREVIFAFFVMICVLAINGMIIGSVMTIVTGSSEEGAQLYRAIEKMRAYLSAHHVETGLVDSATALLRYFASAEGSLVRNQGAIIAELPHSIQMSIDTQTKTIPFLRRCPVFDFCSDELLRGISSKLSVQFYACGDKVVTAGELGHDMFFLEAGVVQARSSDMQTLYATMEEGAFFGEIAFFFRTVRTATIVVSSPFCSCLVLSKEDLERELRSTDFDPAEVLHTFTALQESNERRNKAVEHNLALARTPGTKLHKMLKVDEDTTANESLLLQLRRKLHPDCTFRATWNIVGLLFLMYYSFSIPFNASFMSKDEVRWYYTYMALDVLIDVYWLLDMALQALVFSVRLDVVSDKVSTEGSVIWQHYSSSYRSKCDAVASLPLELFVLVPGMPPQAIFWLRLNHFLRVSQLPRLFELMSAFIQRAFDVTLNRSLSLLLHACMVYLLANHLITCAYFGIHRYAERHVALTYVTADGLATFHADSDTHDICNTNLSYCYARSLYFVVGTTAGICYGDITPFTNLEFCFQILIVLITAFLGATLLGFCELYLQDRDALGNTAIKKKLRDVEQYCKVRKLSPDVHNAILAQYTHMWRKSKSLQAGANSEMLQTLSEPMQMEISLQLQANIFAAIPLLKAQPYHIRRRLALHMHSQIGLPDTFLYRAGDVGHQIFFIATGSVHVLLTADRSVLDTRGLTAVRILLRKQSVCGEVHVAGDHFGEYCVLSQSGLRTDSAKVTTPTEVFALNKTDLWAVFQYMAWQQRREFLYELMTRVGERHHITRKLGDFTPLPVQRTPTSAAAVAGSKGATGDRGLLRRDRLYDEQADGDNGSSGSDARISGLYRLAYKIMSEIIAGMEMDGIDSTILPSSSASKDGGESDRTSKSGSSTQQWGHRTSSGKAQGRQGSSGSGNGSSSASSSSSDIEQQLRRLISQNSSNMASFTKKDLIDLFMQQQHSSGGSFKFSADALRSRVSSYSLSDSSINGSSRTMMSENSSNGTLRQDSLWHKVRDNLDRIISLDSAASVGDVSPFDGSGGGVGGGSGEVRGLDSPQRSPPQRTRKLSRVRSSMDAHRDGSVQLLNIEEEEEGQEEEEEDGGKQDEEINHHQQVGQKGESKLEGGEGADDDSRTSGKGNRVSLEGDGTPQQARHKLNRQSRAVMATQALPRQSNHTLPDRALLLSPETTHIAGGGGGAGVAQYRRRISIAGSVALPSARGQQQQHPAAAPGQAIGGLAGLSGGFHWAIGARRSTLMAGDAAHATAAAAATGGIGAPRTVRSRRRSSVMRALVPTSSVAQPLQQPQQPQQRTAPRRHSHLSEALPAFNNGDGVGAAFAFDAVRDVELRAPGEEQNLRDVRNALEIEERISLGKRRASQI